MTAAIQVRMSWVAALADWWWRLGNPGNFYDWVRATYSRAELETLAREATNASIVNLWEAFTDVTWDQHRNREAGWRRTVARLIRRYGGEIWPICMGAGGYDPENGPTGLICLARLDRAAEVYNHASLDEFLLRNALKRAATKILEPKYWNSTLPPDVKANIAQIVECLGNDCESIWLFGSRANAQGESMSDWDLLLFSNEQGLTRLKERRELKTAAVDLLAVFDGERFVEPWPAAGESPKNGSLSLWRWTVLEPCRATYRRIEYQLGWFRDGGAVEQELCAYRIWPV